MLVQEAKITMVNCYFGDRPPETNLERRARELWPNSEHNQREWLRAVGVVRTHGGWILEDRPATNYKTGCQADLPRA